MIYLALPLIGVDLACEVQTNKGRIDAVLDTGDRFIVTEFKLGPAGEAIAQIHEKAYPVAWRNQGRPVMLLGVGIDSERRNIADWIYVADEAGKTT